MVNLTDITRGFGHGAGIDALSRQYGLDPAQASRAIEALLPAFTLAFQRLMLNPVAFADLTTVVASGRYAPFFDDPGQSQAQANGAAILDQLFRSPEGARQVASQAATMAGLGLQVTQQLMPVLAAMLVGGMFRAATVEGFADLLRQWGDALRAAGERIDPPKPRDPWSAWQAAAGRMMGLHIQPPPAPRPPAPQASVLDAWVAMVGAMTGAAPSTAQPRAPDAPAAPPPPPQVAGLSARAAPDGVTPNPFEAMSLMFDTGREVQAQHLAAFQSVLDNVWGTGRGA